MLQDTFPASNGSIHLCALGSEHGACGLPSDDVASAGVGIDWLIDMRLARAPLLWVGLLCFSAATFLGTLAHVARLKGLKALRYASFCAECGFVSCPCQGHSWQGVRLPWSADIAAVCARGFTQ